MMQALNDDLETLVRAHMDQWFWIHRRWKPVPTAQGDRHDSEPGGGPETVSLASDKGL